ARVDVRQQAGEVDVPAQAQHGELARSAVGADRRPFAPGAGQLFLKANQLFAEGARLRLLRSVAGVSASGLDARGALACLRGGRTVAQAGAQTGPCDLEDCLRPGHEPRPVETG